MPQQKAKSNVILTTENHKKAIMKYSNEDVRRQDRLMSEADAIKLLTDGEYGDRKSVV